MLYITGVSYNGNWKKSIPFYHNFPKYLESRLPYILTFGIIDEDSYIIPTDKYENIDKFMEEYTGEDLKFFYVVKKNNLPGLIFNKQKPRHMTGAIRKD